MNLTKLFTERLEQQLDGVDAKCTIPRVLPLLLAEAERVAEEAGNAFIDSITQKRAIRAFTDSYKVNQPQVTSKKTDASASET